MTVFYDHLITIHDLHIEFDRLAVPLEERNTLMKLADSTVHHEVFDLIMVEIPDEHRVYFLETFSTDPDHPELLSFLEEKIPGFSDKVKERVDKVKGELLSKLGEIK